MIDVNVYLSRWPFRRLPLDDTVRLIEKLREKGVSRAWAGNFDAILHKDVASSNARLADECRRTDSELLVPVGCVNPMLPDWEEDLRRCHELHRMPGIRLHPNYHGYDIHSDASIRLLQAAAERKLVVQIAIQMEDERTQHHLVRVPPVDVSQFGKILSERNDLNELTVVLLNSQRSVRGSVLGELAQQANVYVDVAAQEGVGGIARLIEQVSVERILFGSYSPFYYFESAELKLRESDLGGAIRQAIMVDNAKKLGAD